MAGAALATWSGSLALFPRPARRAVHSAAVPSSKQSSSLRRSQNYRRVSCRTGDSDVAASRGDSRQVRDVIQKPLETLKLLEGWLSRPKEVDSHKISFPFYAAIGNMFCDALENSVVRMIYASSKPMNYYMLGNYAPVEEFGPEEVVSVTGYLPDCLNGELLRIGPNPKFKPVAKYHWFDGDGYAAKNPDPTIIAEFLILATE